MPPELSRFDPAVAGWFRDRFCAPTEPQARGWPVIAGGGDVLITAPTGSGKTLAAFLSALDRLTREARSGSLADETRVVHVSPLKALSADIRRNLETPLAEIASRAEAAGAIRAELRTGDTPAAERARMIRKPPHILVTTPESLYLLLTAGRGRTLLRTADTVIVDEIHALARDKRGSHLTLSLERLDRLAGRPLQRIGLSATVSPVEEVARFLSPRTAGGPAIVPVGHQRELDLRVEVPGAELGAVATHEVMEDIEDRIAALIEGHPDHARLREHAADGRAAHPRARGTAGRGGRARAPREPRPRCPARRRSAGSPPGTCAPSWPPPRSSSASIVGSVDLVCQLGSPRSIAVALQRVGRSGHWLGATPKGRLFPTTRDDLVECAALVTAVESGDLDRIRIPEAPLDILAQQLVAETAATPEAPHFRRRALRLRPPRLPLPQPRPRPPSMRLISMLSEGTATARGRRGAFLHRDSVAGAVRARRAARLAAIQNGGAIPETAQYQVVAEPDDRIVGQVDEDFAVESYRGDVFLLGTTSWRIRRIAQGQVRVEDAGGAAPTIPFWRGEAPGRTAALSAWVSDLRERVDKSAPEDARALLIGAAGLDAAGADQVIRYLAAGRAALGAVPSRRTVVAERFFDESGGMQLVIHAPFGSRVNRAWGLALRKRFCRSFNLELQAAATDDGIVISLTDLHSFPLASVFRFLSPASLEPVLTQAVLGVPLFGVRWRWTASRALAVPAPPERQTGAAAAPADAERRPPRRGLSRPGRLRREPSPARCGFRNTRWWTRPSPTASGRRWILDGLRKVLEDIRSGAIRTLATDTPEASPFAAEILNANPFAFLDPAPLEERRARAVQMRRTLPPELDPQAILDPEAIARAESEAAPLVRDPEELHDALLTVGAMPARPEWTPWFAALESGRRAGSFDLGGITFWVAAERAGLARAVWPQASFPRLAPAPEPPAGDAAAAILRGFLDHSGPTTAAGLAARLALPEARIAAALAVLEAEGLVLQGRFRTPEGPTEWCHRRVLARIHRLTLARLRRESAPVSAAAFLDFLAGWQHATAETPAPRCARGADGARPAPGGSRRPPPPGSRKSCRSGSPATGATGWTRTVLSGEVVWGRVSRPDQEPPARPTRAAPGGSAASPRSGPLAPAPFRTRRRPLLGRRDGAPPAPGAWRPVLRRTGTGFGPPPGRARRRALGIGRRRARDRRRVRQPARPHGSPPAERLRPLPKAEGALLAGPLGGSRRPRGAGNAGRGRGARPPVARPLGAWSSATF